MKICKLRMFKLHFAIPISDIEYRKTDFQAKTNN